MLKVSDMEHLFCNPMMYYWFDKLWKLCIFFNVII